PTNPLDDFWLIFTGAKQRRSCIDSERDALLVHQFGRSSQNAPVFGLTLLSAPRLCERARNEQASVDLWRGIVGQLKRHTVLCYRRFVMAVDQFLRFGFVDL